ncbi:MAG: hypothetical protein A2583_02945 [Bdellovibrionales bacterium RIFOXYD1_FULL_53_11]|nr:MAG: hypothetical protein A2583_02945 [Bdellovibrionales bacterium RIFOXYD1_FULL_53_11]
MANLDPKKMAQLFSAYIGVRKIVIADESSSSRAGLAKTMIDMGAKASLITMASSYSVAESEIARVKPHVVICDYDLGKAMGLTLLQMQRKSQADTKNSLFVLVTGNTSQSAVAQAAEEDVDTFIIKPYTVESIRRSIMQAAILKVYPNDYQKTVDEGKKLLFEAKPDEAIALFDKAMTLHPKPSLACFYKGQAELMKQMMDNAQGDYMEGLAFNKIHYKCMTGLYDLFMQKQMYSEAYDIVKKLSRYFPANPQRLASVMRLAIMTKSYEDIEGFYRNFMDIEARTEELSRYVTAALVVCGKYYFQNDLPSRALELMNKAAITAAGRTKVLREIIITLLSFKQQKQAQDFLNRFPAETRKGADFLSMELVVLDGLVSVSKTIENGRRLLQQDLHDPAVYTVLIRRSNEAKLFDAAEQLLQTAVQKWPQQAKEFQDAASEGLRKSGGK